MTGSGITVMGSGITLDHIFGITDEENNIIPRDDLATKAQSCIK